MTSQRIGITGAAGRIGGGVSRRLEEAGIDHRLLVRSPLRAAERVQSSEVHLQAATCDFARPQEAAEALHGLDTVLFVSGHESGHREQEQREQVQRDFVDALRQAGVRHVVHLSFMAASPEAAFAPARTHWAAEQALRDSGMDVTLLRSCFYLETLAEFAGDSRTLRGPAGQGRAAGVARADVIDAAASVLEEPQAHRGLTYTLTGPEALSLDDVARILTEATGEQHEHRSETIEEARASREPYDVPEWLREGWISACISIASGELSEVTDDVVRLTGRAPRSLADVLRRRTGV